MGWHIAMKRSGRKVLKKNPLGRAKEKLEKAKASVRAIVVHPFHVLKNRFRHRKTCYCGLAKNTSQLFALVRVCQSLAGWPNHWERSRQNSVLSGNALAETWRNLLGNVDAGPKNGCFAY